MVKALNTLTPNYLHGISGEIIEKLANKAFLTAKNTVPIDTGEPRKDVQRRLKNATKRLKRP